MKIRTTEQLSDALSAEISWRKRELTNLKVLIDGSPDNLERERVLCRCGIAMLYAHWEGFVKKAGSHFLEYIVMQRHKSRELKDNLLALMVKTNFPEALQSGKSSNLVELVDFFINKLDSRTHLLYKKAINTESNLSSTVFREISYCLGIDYSPYKGSESFFDSKLLNKRNHVAHGEELKVSADDYMELHSRTIEFMDILKNQLENSAVTGSYKR